MKKKEILNIKELLMEVMNSSSIDFINDYSISNNESNYLSDLITEFSDRSVSIYYTDQYNYWSDNSTECEDALLELYDSNSLGDIIKNQGLYNLCCTAGVCGWFRKTENELYSDIDNICKCLLLDYVLEHFNRYTKKEINYIYKLNELLNVL